MLGALLAQVLHLRACTQTLAVIATAGGFLAPILVSTGKDSHIALFTYNALLNLGVFAVA